MSVPIGTSAIPIGTSPIEVCSIDMWSLVP